MACQARLVGAVRHGPCGQCVERSQLALGMEVVGKPFALDVLTAKVRTVLEAASAAWLAVLSQSAMQAGSAGVGIHSDNQPISHDCLQLCPFPLRHTLH